MVSDGQEAKGLSGLLRDIPGLGMEGWGSRACGAGVVYFSRDLLPDFTWWCDQGMGLAVGESEVRMVVGLRFP